MRSGAISTLGHVVHDTCSLGFVVHVVARTLMQDWVVWVCAGVVVFAVFGIGIDAVSWTLEALG